MDQELEQARIKHLAFKSKVRALLYGAEVETDALLSEDECALGKWISETGRKLFAHLPELAELEKAHLHMHRIVGKLVDLCRNNQFEDAQKGMPEVEEASNLLTVILENLDKRLKTSA